MAYEWIGPALQVGGGLINAFSGNSANNSYVDYLKQQEAQDYQNQLANRNAALDYMNKYQQYQAGQSAAKAKASGAAAAAQNSFNSAMSKAKIKEDKNKMKAEKKGFDALGGSYQEALSYARPFFDAGVAQIPGLTKVAQGGNDLYAKALTAIEGLSANAAPVKPITQQEVPNIGQYMTKVPQGGANPLLAEYLKSRGI